MAYVIGASSAPATRRQSRSPRFKTFEEVAPAAFERVAPDPRAYAAPAEFTIMSYSGSGDVTAALTPVDLVLAPSAPNSSTSGCESADFPASTTGTIALLQRGSCPFATTIENAQAAGAIAAVVFNEGQAGRTDTVAGTSV